MSIQTEIERRFLLKKAPSLVTPDQIIFIQQWYKESTAGIVRYRQSKVYKGELTYEKIIKRNIDKGVNTEEHFNITKENFEEEIADSNLFLPCIRKTRNIYFRNGFKFEVDTFDSLALVICEVELIDIAQQIQFPNFISSLIIKEITGEKEFSNYSLASV